MSVVFKALCRQSGLPEPVEEYRFDAKRKWRIDYAWPGELIALEVEGAVWTNGRHTRGSGFTRDMEKYNRMAVLGWRLIRVTPNDLCRAKTIEMISEMMANRRAA